MQTCDYFSSDRIRLGLPSTTSEGTPKAKENVIYEMIDHLVDAYDLSERQREMVEECVLYRERQKSTGMEREVAIPHGKAEQVEGLIVALGVYPDGVEFDCIDKRPAKFVLMAVADYERATEHLQFLSQGMRVLQREDVHDDILAATQPQEVYEILKREFRPLPRM